MRRLFADSSAFIALAKTNDDNHRRAREFFENLPMPFRIVTSDYILDETATRLRDSLGADKAVVFCEKILASGLHQVVFVDRKIFCAALGKMRKMADQALSFTDCTSFVLMEQNRLKTAFAFDEDFARAGFEMVPSPY